MLSLPLVICAVRQVGEATLTPRFHDLLCNGPSDRMIISHTENKPFFSVELHIERFLLGEFYRRIMVICYRDLPSYPGRRWNIRSTGYRLPLGVVYFP